MASFLFVTALAKNMGSIKRFGTSTAVKMLRTFDKIWFNFGKLARKETGQNQSWRRLTSSVIEWSNMPSVISIQTVIAPAISWTD